MRDPQNFLPHYLGNISEFTFPYLTTEHEYRYITVTNRGRQGDDRWIIFNSSYCYNRASREWEYEMRVSEREEEWMAQTRMTLEEALPLARELCAELKKQALSKISRIMVIRVKRALADEDPRLEEYRKGLAEWQVERKKLEEQ